MHRHRLRLFGEMLFDFSFVIIGLTIVLAWKASGLPVSYSQLILFAAILAVCMLAINTVVGLYQRIHNRPLTDWRARAVLSLYLSIPVAYIIYAALPITSLNRDFVQLSAMAAVFGMLVNRINVINPSLAHKRLRKRIMVLGTGPQAQSVVEALNKSDPSAEIVGFYRGPNEDQVTVPRERILSNDESLWQTALDFEVQEIVIALSERRGGSMPLRELLDCKLHGIKVLDLASHFEQTLGQIRLESLYAGWLIFGNGFRQGALRSTVKRISDIVFSLTLLLVALPIMLITAILIVLESKGPVFYSQERVGQHGRLFRVVKFRSMRTDAEKDGKPIWAQKQDDRITRVGRVIRKLRIDELPQLLCVLRGEMSLVGPRPERQYFVEQLTRNIPFYAVRHTVKPGLTGWAQVRYHYGGSVEDSAEKLQYDLYYVKNHSLLMDIVILMETVAVVVTARGAQ